VSQSGDGMHRRQMSDINIIPLVDVVLVLLIIFMVTAPLMQSGLDLELPKVSATGIDVSEGLVVDLLADGSLRVGELDVTVEELDTALEEAGAASRPVFLRADATVPYGEVAKILGSIRESGVTNLALVTEPDTRNKRRRR
jgi:biopolymer transport protein ExbD